MSEKTLVRYEVQDGVGVITPPQECMDDNSSTCCSTSAIEPVVAVDDGTAFERWIEATLTVPKTPAQGKPQRFPSRYAPKTRVAPDTG